VSAKRAGVAVRAWCVQRLSLAVVPGTLGVRANMQLGRAKWKRVAARAQHVGSLVHCVRAHTQRVGGSRTGCGLVHGVGAGLGDGACTSVRGGCVPTVPRVWLLTTVVYRPLMQRARAGARRGRL
jgi:hypothetical protein